MSSSHFDSSIDYFAILGVHYNACEKTVKTAYRRMARRYHPDVSKMHNATEKFQEMSQAYEVLSKHRVSYCKEYDRVSRKAYQTKTEDTRPKQSASDREASLEAARKRRSQTRTPVRGRDRHVNYPISLRYAIRLLKIGHFYIPGLKVKMRFERDVFDDKIFRLKGKGYLGLFGGESGDYLVRFNVSQSSGLWRLNGGNLHGQVSLPRVLIEDKRKVEIESPAGLIEITIPFNYQEGTEVKVFGQGLPIDTKHAPGHLFVVIKCR